MEYHQPVLLSPILRAFSPQPGDVFIDATLGNGGHTIELLKTGSIVYGIDQDQENLNTASLRIKNLGYSNLFIPIFDNFSNLEIIIKENINRPIKGILFDLGLSVNQLKSNNRGFSFNDTNSLDMRLDKEKQPLTAEFIINTYSENQLFDIFSKIGQERYSREIAALIIQKRHHHPIKSASIMADIIKYFYLQKGHKSHLNPATKILMALRIVVNNESDNLKNALTACLKLNQTIIAIITFHSGEDRIVKQFIRSHSNLLMTPIIPIQKANYSEIKTNPLSRSSLLRVFKIK